MTDTKVPTLTDAKGMGGIIAQDGFDYQVWDAIARVPAWLINPNFEGFIVEGLEDFEARFFAPHTPRRHLLDRFQAKSGELKRSDIVDVFDSFKVFKAAYPDVSRVQTLVTPALPSKLNWVARDPGRVQKARPFYGPFPDVCTACDDQLRKKLTAEFGDDLGGYCADYIEIDIRVFPDCSHAETAFITAMQSAFPEIDVSLAKMKAAFTALVGLVGQNRGRMLSRRILIKELQEALGMQLLFDDNLCIHIRSDQNEPVMNALEIDATVFSGANGLFPAPAIWHSALAEPLAVTAKWAKDQSIKRIFLSGGYRLSTAFAVGWSFRSAVGFEIDIPTRSGTWMTDEHPLHGTQQSAWELLKPKCLMGGRLIVSIGVLRDHRLDVKCSLGLSGDDEILIATLPRAVVDGIDAQSSVQYLKTMISQVVSELNPTGIDLFYVGPAALAVALGHRWNALPSTQFYEFVVSQRKYVPTVVLG